MVRALQRSILGRNCGASFCSIRVQLMPRRPSATASVRPTGPAPAIRTWVSKGCAIRWHIDLHRQAASPLNFADAAKDQSMPAHDEGHRHNHDHGHDHAHGSELSDPQARVRALETVLTEKGYIDPAALDVIVDTFQTKIGPRNGARIVARAWSDPTFKKRLLENATEAVNALGHVSPVARHLIPTQNP